MEDRGQTFVWYLVKGVVAGIVHDPGENLRRLDRDLPVGKAHEAHSEAESGR